MILQKQDYLTSLLQFLKDSPTPYHGTNNLESMLKKAGFSELHEQESWKELSSGRYYFKKNDSALAAFLVPHKDSNALSKTGIRLVGAHLDSPCLRIKPNMDLKQNYYWQVGVEIYGGVILSSWFDRDLSLAGRVSVLNKKGEVISRLVNIKEPIAIIPNLAIHLNREINENHSINKQKEMPPLLGIINSTLQAEKLSKLILKEFAKTENIEDIEGFELLSHDLRFYPSEPPSLVGVHQEFISSARLDNLLSCFVGIVSLINYVSSAPNQKDLNPIMVVCFDHEEVGSSSEVGAVAPIIRSLIDRIWCESSHNLFYEIIGSSLLFSLDNAQGAHPNYLENYDPDHLPLLNKGPALKVNSNMRYATSCDSGAIVQYLAKKEGLPLQTFVSRCDKPCGSTIGPITTANLGVRGVDLGIPQLAMHAAREVCGHEDPYTLTLLMESFYKLKNLSVH